MLEEEVRVPCPSLEPAHHAHLHPAAPRVRRPNAVRHHYHRLLLDAPGARRTVRFGTPARSQGDGEPQPYLQARPPAAGAVLALSFGAAARRSRTLVLLSRFLRR